MSSEAWVEARRVARRLSNTGVENAFGDRTNYLHDFWERVNAYLRNANIDKRAKAIGPDLSFLVYEIAVSENDSWTEMLWSYETDLRIWEEMLRPISPAGEQVEPLKILTHLVSPSAPTIPAFSGVDRHYTFLNTTELYCLEEFFFNHTDGAEFGPFTYSAIDMQDVIDGSVDEEFDLIRLWSWSVVRPTRQVVRKFLDSLRVGGVIVINDASNLNQIYDNSAKAHYSPYYDMAKYIARDERFVTYHMPHNIGVIVARRIQ